MRGLLLTSTILATACGGKAILDPGGQGGAGSTTSSVDEGF